MTSAIDAYLAGLRVELQKRGLRAERIVEETREHLVDAVDRALAAGLSRDAAERDAIARFGAAHLVAANFASDRSRLWSWLLPALGALFGLGHEPPLVWRHRARHTALDPAATIEFHDRPAKWGFVVRSKRNWVNPELLALASDPDAQLVPFLERVAPAPLGPLGPVQSVTLVEDRVRKSKLTRTYRAVFGAQGHIVCTVTLAADGTGISINWSRRGSVAE